MLYNFFPVIFITQGYRRSFSCKYIMYFEHVPPPYPIGLFLSLSFLEFFVYDGIINIAYTAYTPK